MLMVLVLIFPANIFAQVMIRTMQVHEKNGTVTTFNLSQVEKIVFDGPQIGYMNNLIRDADGNTYQAVTIGNQVWMATNLRTTKYNDGTPIKNVQENDVWAKLTEGAYSWYMNNADNKEVYGALYNWYAVTSGKLCPPGWHVPANSELRALIDFLLPNPGDKLKVAGNSFWKNNLGSASNESGFSALPGGARQLNGSFHFEGAYGQWWSSAPGSDHSGEGMMIHDNSFRVTVQGIYKVGGASVRCIKD